MGQEIFVAECVGCHTIKPPNETETIKEVLKHKAPSLRFAGSKFKSSFLLAWLQDPRPIRPLVYNSLTKLNKPAHKKLTRTSAADVTRFMMTLRLKETPQIKIRPQESLSGKKLFSQRYSCYSCHQLYTQSKTKDGKTTRTITGGLSGPSLVGAGARLNPTWVYTFLTEPRSVLPKGSMPEYAGIIDDDDLVELTKYLSTLK